MPRTNVAVSSEKILYETESTNRWSMRWVLVNEHQHHLVSTLSLSCSVTELQLPEKTQEELLCALLLLLPVVLLTALLFPLSKLRLFRDGVGNLFRFGFVLFWGKREDFLQECNENLFSLQLSLSPFTFSTTEVRHCFASSFLSCGCFFFTLSLFVTSFFLYKEERAFVAMLLYSLS